MLPPAHRKSWKGSLFELMDTIAVNAEIADGVPRYRGDVKIVLMTDGPTGNKFVVGAMIGDHVVEPEPGNAEYALTRLLEELRNAPIH